MLSALYVISATGMFYFTLKSWITYYHTRKLQWQTSLYFSRIQEVRDENYDPKADFEAAQRERSKSAPSESPKNKKKESSKKKKIGQSSAVNGSESAAVRFILFQCP